MAESPEFRVESEGHTLGFIRVESGEDEGAVWVHYYRPPHTYEPLGMVMIPAAEWPSVLAHLSASPHDGDTFAAAKDFHAGRINPVRATRQQEIDEALARGEDPADA